MADAQPHREPRTLHVELARVGPAEVILDGLITNAAELRCLCGLPSNRSDADVILWLYQRRGVAGLAALRGEFALVIGDSARAQLVAARDPLGVKPLHHARTDDGHAVASEAWPVALAHSQRPRPNVNALARWLTGCYAGVRETLFDAVFSVPPGCAVIISHGGVAERRLWSPDVERRVSPPSFEACVDELEQLLRGAIEARCPERRAAVAVSGGLDSTTIARLARHASDVHLYTMTFPGLDCDESPWTEPFARALDVPLLSVDVLAAASTRSAPGTIGATPELYLPNVEFLRPLAQLARRSGEEALFFGLGADQLMARRPVAAIADALRKGRVGAALGIARRAAVTGRHRFGLVRAATMYKGTPEVDRPPWLTRRALQRSRTTAEADVLDGPWGKHTPGGEPWRVVVGHGMHEWVGLAERLLATEGIELRLPFLDAAVVEYVLALPLDYRIGSWRGPGKPLLRAHAPTEIAARGVRTHFGSFGERQLRVEHHKMLLERFRRSRLADLGLVEPGLILAELTSGTIGTSLLLVIAAEIWLQSLWR